MKRKIKDEIKNYVPYGIDTKKIYTKILAIYLIPVLFSMQFLFRFFADRANYLAWKSGKVEFPAERIPEMRDFVCYLGNGFVLFPVAIAGCLFLIIPMYCYHFQGGKSIYLMKRLPDASEWRRRLTTVPILSMVVLFLLAVLVFAIYYGIYSIFVPKGSVSPYQWEILINVWLRGGTL